MNTDKQIDIVIGGLKIVRKDIQALTKGAEFDAKSYSAMLEIMDDALHILRVINKTEKQNESK